MMEIVLGLIAVGWVAWLVLRRRDDAPSRSERPLSSGPASVPAAISPPAVPPDRGLLQHSPTELADRPPTPQALADFCWVEASGLAAADREALLARLRVVPRPPHAFHQWLSPEFLASASSLEMSELVQGEPLIAAKVLAAVNAPFYGLQKPVASLGQAVTFLGLNTVRAVCLQYLLDASFKAQSADQQRVFDAVWQGSAVASRLAARVAQQMGWADQGALVTQVVLYFLGRLATNALLPVNLAQGLVGAPLLQRLQAEQQALGLNSSEMGALLMQEWALPASVIADVRDIDRLLDTPWTALDAARAPRLALCYACARVGEAVAAGQAADEVAASLQGPAAEFWLLNSVAPPEVWGAIVTALQRAIDRT